MIPKAFNDVDASDIRALVAGAATETRSLEFKLEVPGNRDSDKTEFKTDVAALANKSDGRGSGEAQCVPEVQGVHG